MSDTFLPEPTLAAPSRGWDRAGVLLSGLCAVHCLLMPLLLIAVPLGHGTHALHEAWHPVMAVLLVPVTLRATRREVSPNGARMLRIGLAIVWLGVGAHAWVGEAVGVGLTLVGSVVLLAGHRCNLCCACSTTGPQ